MQRAISDLHGLQVVSADRETSHQSSPGRRHSRNTKAPLVVSQPAAAATRGCPPADSPGGRRTAPGRDRIYQTCTLRKPQGVSPRTCRRKTTPFFARGPGGGSAALPGTSDENQTYRSMGAAGGFARGGCRGKTFDCRLKPRAWQPAGVGAKCQGFFSVAPRRGRGCASVHVSAIDRLSPRAQVPVGLPILLGRRFGEKTRVRRRQQTACPGRGRQLGYSISAGSSTYGRAAAWLASRAFRRLPQGTITIDPSSRRIRWFLGRPLVALTTTVPALPWWVAAPDMANRML